CRRGAPAGHPGRCQAGRRADVPAGGGDRRSGDASAGDGAARGGSASGGAGAALAGAALPEVLLARLAQVNAACPQDYRRLDTLFHLSIAELTGSSLLATACADARMRLNGLLNAFPGLRRNIDQTARQHTAIVVAILAGDAPAARRAVAEHLDGTGALLRGFLA